MSRDCQVLVAGGGMAGLCTALTAAEAGAEVIVLEKGERVGGSAALSAGLIWSLPDWDRLREWIPGGDPLLQRLLAAELEASWAWLERQDLPLSPTEVFREQGRGRRMALGEPGRRGPFMEAMRARAEARGARVLTRRALRTMQADPSGSVSVSVEVESPNGREAWLAQSVVLATGSYAANRELLTRYMGPDADNLLIRACPLCTGDGFEAGLAAGAAATSGLGLFYGHTMPAAEVPPEEYQTITPYFANTGVLVNRYGRRFTDESAGLVEEHNAHAGMQQPGGRYYLIFDGSIYRDQVRVPDGAGPDKFQRARELGAPTLEAPTLEALVEAMETHWGVHGPALREELNVYNRSVSGGAGAALVPPRRGRRQPLAEAPFYAMACIPAITIPYGGLRVDDQCRVLNRAGSPMAGLWAAGADAGGVFHGTYAGGLAWALVSGRVAGRGGAAHSLQTGRRSL